MKQLYRIKLLELTYEHMAHFPDKKNKIVIHIAQSMELKQSN